MYNVPVWSFLYQLKIIRLLYKKYSETNFSGQFNIPYFYALQEIIYQSLDTICLILLYGFRRFKTINENDGDLKTINENDGDLKTINENDGILRL